MAAWLIPALKSVLPHVGTIISAAAPVFTKKSVNAAANQTILLQQQVTELQTAASESDAHIKELAIQMQNTLEVLETGSSLAEKRHQRIMFLCLLANIISVTSLAAVLYIILAR